MPRSENKPDRKKRTVYLGAETDAAVAAHLQKKQISFSAYCEALIAKGLKVKK